MKIGILTQSLGNNYGGLLQNYALQTVLKRKGFDVCTLDWMWINNRSIKSSIIKIIKLLLGRKVNNVYKPTESEMSFIHKNVNHFRDTYITHTRKFKSKLEFVEYDEKEIPGAYIVGSDQCWRPKYNPFQEEMFLNFVHRKGVKRIAYAASFGTDDWEFPNVEYSRLAKLFDLITVREKSGIKLCERYLKTKAQNVLDPTLLLDKDDYIRLIEKEGEKQSGGNLFYYILDPTQNIINKIEAIGKEYSLIPFKVLPKYKEEYRTKENVKENIDDCVYPSPTKWLKGIMDAKMTVVDSFHGMVFSIIFNKPFWVLGNANRGMSRFTSLLEQIGLENRLIDISAITDIDLFAPINWNMVNEIIAQKRKESLSILFNALMDE